MDFGRIRSELWKSVRIVWTDERWLLAGPVVLAFTYALWVGVTGAAISYLGPMADLSLAVDPWTGTTTALAGLVALLWVVVPAVATAYLVDRQLTNHRDNLRLCYRLGHPVVLLWPPALLLAAGVGALFGLATEPVAVLVLLVAAAAFLVVRTVAYGYRVVSFSSPILLQVVVFLSAATLSVAVLVGAATAAGREDILADAGAGLAGAVGVPGIETVLAGTVEVVAVPVPGAVALAVGTMVGLSVMYLAVQSAAGLVLRVRKPTMKRSQLRTGQRFPWFLKPGATRDDNADGSSSTGSATATTASSAAPTATSGTTAAAGTDGGSATGGTPGTPSKTSSGGSSTASTDDDLSFLATDDQPAADEAPADEAATAERANEDDGVDESGSVSHTRVFSPDRDLPDDAGPAGSSDAGSTPKTGEVLKRCPACDEEYGRDVTGSFCPDCGARLETV